METLQSIEEYWAERLGYDMEDYKRRMKEHVRLGRLAPWPTQCLACKHTFYGLQELLTTRCLVEKTKY